MVPQELTGMANLGRSDQGPSRHAAPLQRKTPEQAPEFLS
jgi:hypothetical protein